jgi:menaquinone-specific isochorismate synthase
MHTAELDDIKKQLIQAIKKTLDTLPEKTLKSASIQRAETAVSGIAPLDWLNGQNFHTKIFWARRDEKHKIAVVGAVHHIITDSVDIMRSIRRYLHNSHRDIRYFGGMRFDVNQKIEHHWLPYAKYRFVAPQIELTQKDDKQSLAINFSLQPGEDLVEVFKKTKELVEQIQPPESLPSNGLPKILSREENPDRARWTEMVNQALAAIDRDEFEKIVLAGNRLLTFAEDINPLHLLKNILKKNGNSFHFGFQFQNGVNFIGMTPECLYQRDGENIYTEAIAGTRLRGSTPDEDAELGKEMLSSDKDLREHRWVKKMILDRLRPLCEDIKPTSNEQLLPLSHVQHLQSQFSGRLRKQVADEDIIKALHPTPAVGGYPKKTSVDRIAQLEPFDRGWYAAPVGWVSSDAAEFAVAIRSALVSGEKLRIFAGSGIVKGSNPDAEWEENRNKEQNFLQLFDDE